MTGLFESSVDYTTRITESDQALGANPRHELARENRIPC
jgi:hypothetical protein